MSKHDLRPVVQIPFPEGLDPVLRDKIIDEWMSTYEKFQKEAEAMIERAGGKDKLQLEIIGDNPLRDIVIRFL